MEQMTVTSREALRSLTNECGRQADFFDRKGQSLQVEFWSALEALAFSAQRTGRPLVIELREASGEPANEALIQPPDLRAGWECPNCKVFNTFEEAYCVCGIRR